MPLRKGGRYGYRYERPRTSRTGLTRKPPTPTGIPYGVKKLIGATGSRRKVLSYFQKKQKERKTIGRLRQRALASKPKRIKFYGLKRGRRKKQ